MNKVILVGHVGQDPKEVTANLVTFSLATTKRWKKDGEKKEKTEWHNCQVNNKLADVVQEYVKKGSKLLVEGEITYTKRDEKYYTNIRVFGMEMLDSKPRAGNSEAAKPKPKPEAKKDFPQDESDDLPF